jgi:hypothetical protein
MKAFIPILLLLVCLQSAGQTTGIKAKKYTIEGDSLLLKTYKVSASTSDSVFVRDGNGITMLRAQSDIGTGGSGEVNTASNLGSGTGLFAQKSVADLQFKSLVAGTNTSITNDATTVTVSIPSDLVNFTPRFSAGAGQGDVNISIPVGQLYIELFPITASNNLTVGLSTSSTSGSQTLYHVIANTNTNPTYNWTYSATVKKADGTTVTTIPNGKSHTLFYNGSYWMLTSEY